MTEKTLGQVAWDAIGDVPWQSLEAWQQKDCETMAQAVVAAVREHYDSAYGHAIDDCISAIRNMK